MASARETAWVEGVQGGEVPPWLARWVEYCQEQGPADVPDYGHLLSLVPGADGGFPPPAAGPLHGQTAPPCAVQGPHAMLTLPVRHESAAAKTRRGLQASALAAAAAAYRSEE